MADDTARDRTDEEIGGADEDAASAAARAMAMAICVSGPGIVTAFDAVHQTVTVQPAIKKKFRGAPSFDVTPCVNCPVALAGGGELVMTVPIKPGDECWLVFGDRAIDNWLESGGTQEPSEIRFHDRSDAMAIVGISSNPRALPDYSTEHIEIRTRNGQVVFRAVNGGGQGAGGGGVQAATLSDALLDCIAAMSFATGMGPTGIGPLNIADFRAKIKSLTAFIGE